MVYFFQYGNPYDQTHLLGFIFFVWSMPLINHAVRYDSLLLRRVLTYLTLFNALMGFYLLVSSVDLYGLRGLNRVEGSDGITYRIYFEASSLAAVFLLSSFRNRWVRLAALGAVAIFVVFVAKSVVIMALLGLNLALPYLLRSRPHIKVGAAIIAVTAIILLYNYLPIIRPDMDLSLRAKQFQFNIIMGLLPDNWSGLGWGFYMPQLSSDPEQPYQVEMQLPMLMLQLGPIALLTILLLILSLFLSVSGWTLKGFARFAVYVLIGYNNPWLFVPSWFLTCQLLFRDDDEVRRSTVPRVPSR
ncbi:MAG: hypothetical protein BGN95_18195 [Sphingomonas sp. 66-10]|nr:MAG: hypothetical protein BGN95_18195 [Sphingomonas sp. 66-10]